MRIRQFGAPTTTDALRALREALGDEALVLSTHDHPDGGVVITAAVDGEPDVDPLSAPIAQDGVATDEVLRSDVALIRVHLEQLGRRMQRMDRVLRELDGGRSPLGPDGREVADRLVASGFGRDLAEPVAEAYEREVGASSSRESALAASLVAHVAVAPAPAARVTAFVGPTGGGKTTTIAKLAARDVREGRPAPALVAADTHRIGAVEELAAYARLLDAPLVVAREPGELRAALASVADRERVLVVTAVLCGDTSCGGEVHQLVAAAGEDAAVVAVVSATASLRSLHGAWPQIARLRPRSCAVTKLDECDEAGTACSWLAEVGLPLAWLGIGRRLPDDLLPASGAHLVRWLVAA
jgi:flagellar biosynthesis protein FlhF